MIFGQPTSVFFGLFTVLERIEIVAGCIPKRLLKRKMAPAHEELYDSPAEVGKRLDNHDFFVVPFDPRFPNQNQAKRCWVNFVDYHRCMKMKGEDYEPCFFFKKVFRAICPNAWVTKWTEQLEAGIFPYDFEKDLKGDGSAKKDSHGHH